MREPVLGREATADDLGELDFLDVDAPVRCTFETEELQALCPGVPGIQPDIYRAVIDYVAHTRAIESKSLKLWLVTFRDRRIFAEHLVVEIGRRIEEVDGLELVEVVLTQNIRGGLRETVRYPAAL